MQLDFSQVLEMKKAVDEVFHLNVHFHDACGGQYFSLDEKPTKELEDFITDYFAKKNITVDFTTDRKRFTLE